MTTLISHGAPPDVPELILILRYEHPVPVADLAALLSAFATDYGRVNRGRALVVATLETGSIIVHLREALDTIAPIVSVGLEFLSLSERLKKFIDKLQDFIGKSKDDPRSGRLFQNRRSAGVKSAEQMANMTIACGGEVEVSHKGPSGEETSVRLTSAEALRIREEAAISRLKLSRPLGQSLAEWQEPGSKLLADYDPALIAEKLVAAGKEAEVIIGVFASILREANMAHVLETVAEKLDELGHHSLAMVVRAHQRDRGSQPSGDA